MNFDWNAEENELRGKVSGLFDDKAKNELASMDELEIPALKDLVLRYLGRLAEIGYMDLGAGPKRRGEMFTVVAVENEFAKNSSSLFLSVETTARLFGSIIAGYGGETLKKDIYDFLCKGRVIGAVAISEPGGVPSTGSQTTGMKDGDAIVVSGKKNYITNGPIADWLAVSGEMDGKSAFFIISPKQKGASIGDRLQTLGYNGLAVSNLELDKVVVPATHVIGPFDNNDVMDYLTMIQDLVLASASVGVGKKLLDEANAYSRSYHRGKKPIYAHQEVRFKISDMYTLIQAAELITYRAGSFFSRGESEAPVMIGCAKVFTAEAVEQISSMAMQIMAGKGYLHGNPVEQGYRDAKYTAIAGTTSEVSRMNIANDILRRFAI